MPNRDLVIHHNDADGYCSAGLISLLNRRLNRDMPLYYYAKYGIEPQIIDELDKLMKESETEKVDTIYILDFSFTIDKMLEIAEKFKPSKVVYLDHHATSKDDMNKWHEMAKNHLIPGKPECFTQNINTECGASLTLKHVRYRCHELRQNHNIEYVVSLCKDYDLWIQKYKNSMPFVTGISADMPHPEVWRKVLTSAKLWQKYAAMGTGILKQQIALAKQILRNPENMEIKTINGCKVLVLNLNPQWVNLVSHTTVENSDIDAVISYSINGLKNVAVSIRSAERCDMHCGEFMKKYFAGGGHKHAAGGRSASFSDFCKTLGYAEKPAVETERNRTLEL